MKDVSLADLTKVITTVVRSELTGALDKKFDGLRDEIGERFNEIDKRFNEVDERFDDVDVRFNEVDKRFVEVANRFDEIDKGFDEVDERFEEVLKAIGEEHEKVVTAIGGHTIELTDHRKRIERLEKQLT